MNKMVSIYCLAYNHEKYISQTLESLINQVCDFEYEIFVHDDASTDATAKIIREFEERYPNKVIGIYQTENQYSKNVHIIKTYIYPLMKGKYIAICEGDDYWTDKYKLQKQVEYMENNPECTFCFTNAEIINSETGRKRDFIPYGDDKKFYTKGNKNYTLNDMYKISFAPTASYLFTYKAYTEMLKYTSTKCPAGDLRARLYLTSQGYAHYIDEKTCVYREASANSVMTSWKVKKRKENYQRTKLILEMLEDLNRNTGGQFYSGLKPFIDIQAKALLNSASSFNVFNNTECKRVYDESKFFVRITIILKILMPDMIYDNMRHLYQRLSKK